MRFSIIIPTFNEEKYIPKLLECIQDQTFTDYEVIVADAGSKDKTVSLAKKANLRIVKGGSPAQGRNAGAAVAKGDFLIFLDADVKISKTFLQKVSNELEERFLDLATCEARPLSNLRLDKVLHRIANVSLKLAQYSSNPFASGFCFIISRRLFERVGGFDESLKLAEDHDLAERAAKFRSLRVLESISVQVSVRRLRKEGRLDLSKKYLQSSLHILFVGKIKDELFDYDFGKHEDTNGIGALEKNLIALDKKYNSLMKSQPSMKERLLKIKELQNKFVNLIKK